MLSVDVGCGKHKIGDFGVDIDKNSNADLICDVQSLPFRDKVFKFVFCYHVLEHVLHPFNALSELKRVCDGKVIIKVPNKIREFEGCNPYHLYTWNKYTLRQLLSRVFDNFDIYCNVRFNRVRIPFVKRILVNVLDYIFLSEITAICVVSR